MDPTKQLSRIEERLDAIDATLIRNTITLEHHVKRTDLLEADLKPVKKHVELVNAAAKLISLVVAAALAAKSLGLF